MHLFYLNNFSFSQCYFFNTAFRSGEIIEYNIKYNLGFIWLDAGYVTFAVDSILWNNEYVYKFTSIGSSYEKYDWIYKVRESYQALAYPSPLKSISYKRNSIEGDYFAIEEYFFDYTQKKTYSTTFNSKKNKTTDTLNFPECGYDLLTAIYAFRNINFENVKPNEKIYINVIIDNKWEKQYLRMIGKETIMVNNKPIATYHLKANMIEGTIFKGGENTDIWISQTKAHIPVYIEAEILVGTVKLFLTKYINKQN
ncbi:MAG: DUF3108 domain-containing protein [Bacteroidales bacterium]|nr:DUF3108 domain-containing protein [Bacteroidales bacterium]